MTDKMRRLKILSLPVAAFGLLLVGASSTQIFAQRDPFAKPATVVQKGSAPRTSNGAPTTPSEKPKPAGPTVVSAPPIQERINYYKRLRENAALNNQPIPNPTVVMTLDELSVTGIFQSARGYAAIVEAKPIKLSYTIYPGDKFFDGQLVAVEENKLIFKKVTKWTNGKLIASEENKPLREYTVDQEVQGTAPIESSGKTESAANTAPADPNDSSPKPAKPGMVVSPLDELNNQPDESTSPATKSAKKGQTASGKKSSAKAKAAASQPVRKTTKVATNKDL